MEEEYNSEWIIPGEQLNITHKKSNYVLHFSFDGQSSHEWLSCPFNERDMMVSGRDFEQYPAILDFDPSYQYIEIGAGLGGFISEIIENVKPDKRPIVIDPINYLILQGLINYARDLKIEDRDLNERLNVLFKRCNLILDISKVDLINLNLKDALNKRKELTGSADVLVDFYAAKHYAHPSGIDRVVELEKSLLKKGGVIVSNN